MGVLSDKIQSFIDSITNAITAMDDDVVEGKAYWKAGSIQQGSLPLVTEEGYSVNLSGDMASIEIAFSQKAYVSADYAIAIPVDVVQSLLATLEDPEDTEPDDTGGEETGDSTDSEDPEVTPEE